MSDFDTFCRNVKATVQERNDLAWHLAMLRARRTYELLRPRGTNLKPSLNP